MSQMIHRMNSTIARAMPAMTSVRFVSALSYCVYLAGSSLPVGGAGIHTAVSGHTGLPSAKLFTGLDSLKEGDTFAFHVLDDTYTYQVDQIRT